MTEPSPDTGCPAAGLSVCDQFVTGGWPDVVFCTVLMLCVAAVVIAWIRRPR